MRGKKVYLAELRSGDAEILTQWQWDEDFMSGVSYDVFHPFQIEDWEKIFENGDSNEEFHFTIRKVLDDSLIGFISLNDVLFKNRNAELGIGIPLAENRHQGFGKEAVKLLLEYAFDHLGLHKVTLVAHENNHHAISLYEKLGFVQEGIDRESFFEKGNWLDQIRYGMLETEWRGEKKS